ncbi:uncharacterized protein LOC143909336 [Arctopsyche grandis]|uniref:uncharacterized protein LOC143909336 n=1 Tax=Arctopsyche grandis TaxID=121162 RepID=UPI00406DA492
MAEEAVTNEEANGEDDATPKINGVEESIADPKESYSADTSSKTDDIPESPVVLHFEDSPTRDNSKAGAAEESDASEVNENANGDADTIESNDSMKNGSLKRPASFSFEDNDEDLIACDGSTWTDRALERLFLSIERLEREVDEHARAKGHSSNKRPRNSSPAHSATTDTVSSRPSSGMSIRSESELINAVSEVSGAGSRVSFSRKSTVDLSNPLFKMPMDCGWRRELVYRANNDQSLRRQADVYYYSPTGKKLRSTREVVEHLIDTDLTVDNFTFFKEPIGLEDPEKEIIREAKVLNKSRTDSPQSIVDDSLTAVSEGKRTPKPKLPKGSSPEQIATGKVKPFKVKSVGSRLNAGSPTTVGKSTPNTESANSPPKARKSTDSVSKWNKSTPDLEDSLDYESPTHSDKQPDIAMSPEKVYFTQSVDQLTVPKIFPAVLQASDPPPTVVSPPSLKKYVAPLANPIANSIANSIINHMPIGNQINNQIANQMMNQIASQLVSQVGSQMVTQMATQMPAQMMGRDMCPMRCPLANLEPPSLQCSLCLCLYHNQCTGYIPSYNTSFVCKNCHLANSSMPSSSSSPSQLSHMSGIRPMQKSPSSASLSGSSVLQRFPKPSPIVTKAPPQPKLVPVVTHVRPKTTFNQKLTKSDASSFKSVQKYPKPLVSADNKMNKNNSTVFTGTQIVEKPQRPTEVDPAIFPQSIAILNGHKFIVVPKPNVANTSPVSGVVANPKQADNAPKIIETTFNISSNTTITAIKPTFKPIEEILTRDENKIIQMKPTVIKNEPFNTQTNVISFDNLSAEYGKLLFKSDPANISFEAPGIKRSLSSDVVEESAASKRKTRGRPVLKLIPRVAKKAENGTTGQKVGRPPKAAEGKNKNYFADFYKINQERKYNSLVQIFQYLKMRELAAAARVCRMWREIADTPALWRSVRMKNSQVNDWEGLAGALKRHGTRHLDLRKMLLPSEVPDQVWDQFTEHIATVDSLLRIDLCRCPASVVERVCARMPQLQALTAMSVRCTELNPSPLTTLTNLQELRIKGMTKLTLTSDLKCLENLTKLKHLSITSVKDLGQCGCIAVGGLTSLESLELGECTGEVGGAALLRHLTSLTRLRLERCPGANGGSTLIRTVSNLPLLRQLELINFDIRPGFEDALGKCTNIKRLLIIPTYVSQSATTNRCVLAGVLRLRNSLTHLVWGVTIELLRVTELFIDQCGRNQKESQTASGTGQTSDAKQAQLALMSVVTQRNPKVVGDCIPVLKPVPSRPVEESRTPAVPGRPQVEILPLPALQRLLAEELPDTRLKLLRIPYHATWRQTFNDFD